jgi:hypothetical protein
LKTAGALKHRRVVTAKIRHRASRWGRPGILVKQMVKNVV